MTEEPSGRHTAERADERNAAGERRKLVGLIVAVTVASMAFRLLVFTGENHTSLVFIGIPALMALALVAVQPKTSIGTVNKVTALALCMSGIVFGEAFVCILLASPIFFLAATCTALLLKRLRKHKAIGMVLILPLSLEGVSPLFEMAREETVTVERAVSADAAAVRATLAAPMRLDAELPPFFKLGFPTPGATSGEGIEVGDRRSIVFEHGGHHPGALVLQVTASTPEAITFAAVSDDSYLTHWLSWRTAEVRLRPVGAGQTLVSWTIHYRRGLDPAWYFKPLERYGVRLAAGYLLETLATPRPAEARND